MKKITRTLWVIIACMLVFSSCGNSIGFWEKENEIPIIINFEIMDSDENSKTVLDQDIGKTEDATDEVYALLYREKTSINKYMEKTYGINVTDKLEKLQQITVFTQKDYKGESLGGFVNESDDVVYLNQKIINDTDLMRSVMVHEIIHYLGVRPAEDGKCRYLIEGLTDAIAQDVVEQEGKFITTSLYEMQRELGKQMITANRNLVRGFIKEENFNVVSHIDKTLKDVPLRTKTEVNSIAEFLENCITSVYYGTAEQTGNTETAMVQAQFIVVAYCKEFTPERQQIKEIRKHYIVQIEEIEVYDE